MDSDDTATTSPSTAEPTSGLPRDLPALDARFTIGAVLGRGGMGEVRQARDTHVDRDVAIKLMRGRPDAAARFLREARVQGRLDHPAIVPVYDLGTAADGTPYFVMKRLTGLTLHQVLVAIADGDLAMIARWPRRLLLARFVDVCLAVELAHTRGVIHRDLKPANIMLGDFGEVYVLDWGVARVAHAPQIATGDLGIAPEGIETAPGSAFGTPGYMPPEQVLGEDVDARADVFALGCILFGILAGEPALPSGRDAHDATLAAASHRPSTRRPDAEIPPELDDACERATRRDARDRFPSARALAATVQAYLDGDRDLARRRQLAADHAATAVAAVRDRGDTARAEAVREAGRALALDPTNAEAKDLMTRLLLQLPRELPPEVATAIEAERSAASRLQMRTASRVFVGFFLCVLLLFSLRIRVMWPVALMLALLAGAAFALAAVARRPHFPQRWFDVALLYMVVLMAVTGIVVGPFQVVPIVVTGSLVAFLTQPSVQRPLRIVIIHVIMAGVPLLLELLGITPSTYYFANGAIHISPWVLEMSEIGTTLSMVVTHWLLLGGIAMIAVRQRRAQEADHERIHLLKWQLHQILPSGHSGPRRAPA